MSTPTHRGDWSSLPAEMLRSPDWPMYREHFLRYISDTAPSMSALAREVASFHRGVAEANLRARQVEIAGVTYDVTPESQAAEQPVPAPTPSPELDADTPPAVGPTAWPWTTIEGHEVARRAEEGPDSWREWGCASLLAEMLCGPHPDGDLALALDAMLGASFKRKQRERGSRCPNGYEWLSDGRCAGGLHMRGDRDA